VAVFDRFVRAFRAASKKVGKEQYVLPYFISSHPGSTIESAISLAEYMNKNHYRIEQVQDFYPTPGTVSTTMFYTGLDPRTLKPVYIPKTREEKQKQRALLQYWDVKNYDTVKATLLTAGRGDLIGFGPEYLIPPRLPKKLEEKGQKAREGAARKNTDRGNKPGKPTSGKPTPGRGEQSRNAGKPSAKSGSKPGGKPFAKKR